MHWAGNRPGPVSFPIGEGDDEPLEWVELHTAQLEQSSSMVQGCYSWDVGGEDVPVRRLQAIGQ